MSSPLFPRSLVVVTLPEGTIRTTEDKHISVYDAIKAATGTKNPYVVLERLKVQYPNIIRPILETCSSHLFKGARQKKTPVITQEDFVKILLLLPGEYAKKFRQESARLIFRYLDKDVTLIEELKEILPSQNEEDLKDLIKQIISINHGIFEPEKNVKLCDVFLYLNKSLQPSILDSLKSKPSERLMYDTFIKNPGRYIKGAKIITKKIIGGSIPDFFLEINGREAIAEFKHSPFKKRHLYQLQEYLDVYQIQRGIAVAPSLVCELPKYVRFIKMLPDALGRPTL